MPPLPAPREPGPPPLRSERKEVTIAPEALTKYVRTYELRSAGTYAVTLQNGQLFFGPAASQQKMPLSLESDTVFFSKMAANVQVTFLKDATGAITGLTFRQGPMDYAGARQ